MIERRPRRSRWWWLIPVFIAALIAPFLLLQLSAAGGESWLDGFYSESETVVTYDEDGNITQYLVNGVPSTPQPSEPDPCGNDAPANQGDGPQGTTFSVSVGCFELFRSFDPDQ